MPNLITIAGLILLVGNCLVTVAVSLGRSYSSNQKLSQSAFIWLLPIIGALVVLYFLREDSHAGRSAGITNGSLTTDGYDFDNGHSDSGHDGSDGGH